ncbi:MAG: response regulator [Deltaproteobacteria bacterium]|nr:response regulator [Deltaproteobacteria bacterium]
MAYKLLLLDYDPQLSTLLQLRFARRDIACDVAADTTEAMASLQSAEYDLLIIDLNLKEHSTGIDFYRDYLAGGGRAPAILVTGFGDESALTAALRLGIRDFIPKGEEFLEVLMLSVDTVLGSVEKERVYQATTLERHSLAQVRAALEAAGLEYAVWDLRSRKVEYSLGLLGQFSDKPVVKYGLRHCLRFLPKTERRPVLTHVSGSMKERAPFEFVCRLVNDNKKSVCIRVRGKFDVDENGKPLRCLGVFWDETNRHEMEQHLRDSKERVEKLNERLQLNLVEIHHRVKNSFQIVNSLLQMELRKKDTLSGSDVRRVKAQIHGLALIHDILTESSKSNPNANSIELRELTDRIVQSLQPEENAVMLSMTEEPLHATPRTASSYAVICTEMLINAFKYGNLPIELSLSVSSKRDKALISVANRIHGDSFADPDLRMSKGSGSVLIDFLAKTDLGSVVERFDESDRYVVQVQIPLHYPSPSESPLPATAHTAKVETTAH